MKTLLKYQKSQFIIKENIDGNTKLVLYCYSTDEARKRLKIVTNTEYTNEFLENMHTGQIIQL